jgi:hypothetical protein
MQKRRKYNPRPPRTPSLREHKPSKQGVPLNGRDHYLGPYGDPETNRKYDLLVAEWLSGGRVLHPEAEHRLA